MMSERFCVNKPSLRGTEYSPEGSVDTVSSFPFFFFSPDPSPFGTQFPLHPLGALSLTFVVLPKISSHRLPVRTNIVYASRSHERLKLIWKR